MEQPKYIYHLVAFPEEYIDAWEAYNKGIDNFRESPHYHHWLRSGVNRGSFLDLKKLTDIIEAKYDIYGICEGYYMYLLIERHYVDCIDGHDFGVPDKDGQFDAEIWYKYTKIDDNRLEFY